ncbi:hypothetical protein BU23DRAFT_572508 [Bimuria novae-zelandiae CBS 107.79]|uniref:Uncharacterized protein n=1 Tax=Bimuria novae-zelandiae CBS 107.79 TaxID=1447943 RepID=A0A6A5UWV4_9PLEO|nr:hypothetical protein BU23DRAFT_572508 [Bimuria novae-zelandiae CBS 107.79]
MVTTLATTFTQWNGLIMELKLHVLSCWLVVINPITAKTHIIFVKRMNLTNLMLANKQMHDLAAKAYYGGNTFFTFTHHSYPRLGLYWGGPVFMVPNFSVGHFVRRLEVMLHFGENFKYGRLTHKHDFRFPKALENQPDLLCLLEPLKGAEGWRRRQGLA